MKKLCALLLALALAASLSLTAFAEESGDPAGTDSASGSVFAPTRVWGKVSPWEGEGVFLNNGVEDDAYREVVVHLGGAPVVDAATGLPLEADAVKEGETLYVWIQPAVMMSLPPQANAIVAVGNVPSGAAVPEFYEVAEQAASDPGSEDAVAFTSTGGERVTLPKDVEIKPWLTRQMVTLADLVPGAQVLVWKNAEGAAEKVILFAYAYQGYLNVTAASAGEILACVNGQFDEETPQFPCLKTSEGAVMVPVRAVAEAAGYDVRWDRTLGAVVSRNGETILSVRPDAAFIQTSEGEAELSAPCILKDGVTYLPAAELAVWLNLFYA